MEEANKLVGTGKKYLVMGKVVEAVGALQEACAMLAKTYGDTADECGEAFFWCGKALLDLARMENSVLGNALEGVPEEEEEENKDKPKDSNVESTENIDEKTRDELREQVYDAMAEKEKKEEEKAEGTQEKAEGADKPPQSEKAEGNQEKAGEAGQGETKTDQGETKADRSKAKADQSEAKADQSEAKADQSEAKADQGEAKADQGEAKAGEEAAAGQKEPTEEPEAAGGDEKEEEEEEGEEEVDGDVEMEGDADEGDATAEKDSEEEEEVGNLQLAWEMLEVAKVIYARKETKEDQLMAAQAHLKLGEVSAESGNYSQALEDFQECLRLQLEHLDADSRLLAETHYQLGVTYGLNLQYGPAIQALHSSIDVIKSRLGKLQGMLDKAEGPESLPDERKEMEELKALLPEIQEKVEDATEGLKTAALDGVCSAFSDVTSTTAVKGEPASSSASTAPASDISHLVRKKRKPEESPLKEDGVKKVKQDDGDAPQPRTNGVHKANGDSNGHADGVEVDSR